MKCWNLRWMGETVTSQEGMKAVRGQHVGTWEKTGTGDAKVPTWQQARGAQQTARS